MSYRSEVLADSPKLYLRLDEPFGTVAADSSGNSHPGTYVGTVTFGVTNAIPTDLGSTAVSLAGASGQYVTIPDHADFDVGAGDFSLEVWYKLNTVGQTTKWFLSKDTQFGLLIGNDGLGNVDNFSTFAAKTSVVINGDLRWHHLVFTRTGNTYKFYLDGTDVTGVTQTQTFTASALAMTVGRENDNFGPIDAAFKDVAFYATVLSSARVLAHWQAAEGNGLDSFQQDSFQNGSFQTGALDSFQDDSFQDDSFQSPHRDLQHQVNADAEVASGTFDVLWDPYELDALDNPEAETIGYATAKAYDATVSTVVSGTSANAEATTATWVANSPSASIAPTAGNAAATGAANAATPSVAPNAGNAAATGAASNPAPSVAPTSGVASATGAANQAAGTVAAAGTGIASATGAAGSPTPSVAPNGGNAGATGAANAPTATISIGGTGSAGGSAAAGSPTSNVAPNAGNAGATGAASNASLSIAPTAGAASATGAASAPAPSVAPNAGIASATGAAFDATVSTETPACTDGSFQYNSFQSDSFQECPYTEANAGVATGTGSAGNASANVAPNAGSASASAAAAGPTSSVSPTAGQATATAAAFNATVVIAVSAGFASATAAAGAPAPSVAPTAALATATGVAYDSTAFIPGQGAGGVPPTIAVFHAMPHLDASAPVPALRPSAPEPDIGPEHPLPILTATHPRT